MYTQLFYQSGFSIVPLKRRSKQPLVKWSQYQQERAPEHVVKSWFFGQDVNLGIVTGYNGLTVIDFDDPGEYLKWLNWIAKQPAYSAAKRAFAVRSRRGVHVYFRLLQPARNRRIGKIDIKGRFGLVTGPGSVHESGVVYLPLNRFYIPAVETLSGILPPALLLSEPVSPVVNVVSVPNMPSDPWEAAACGYDALPGEDLVERVRKAFTIEQFFKTALRKSGNRFYVTQCPFHDDQNPSFWIDAEHQVCGCFVCSFPKPLDVINLYGLLYGLTNRDAILTLARLV